MGVNPCLRDERPTNIRLSHDTFPVYTDELDRMKVEVVVACLKILATWTFDWNGVRVGDREMITSGTTAHFMWWSFY
jgi:hypothetical protein